MLKRVIAFMLCLWVGAFFLPTACSAEEGLDGYAERVGSELSSAIDGDTLEAMRESGISGSDMSGLSIGSLIKAALNALSESLTQPIRTLARVAAVLILSALAQSFAAAGEMSSAFGSLSVLGCVTMIYGVVYEAFSGVCAYLTKLGEFMLSYIPIYASVTAASGGFRTGGSYYAGALGVCELISFAAEYAVMPFLSIFLALSFTAAINPDMRFSSAAESVKNGVRLTLTALMTVFSGMISVQSFSSAAADTAAARAVKFGASSFVPIIGGSVSEAYSTVYSGIGVIRSGVGGIGIAAVAFMLLKPMATLIGVRIMLGIAKVMSDLLGIKSASELLSSTGYAISAAISTVLCFAMMFIISTAVVMTAAAGL